MRKVTLGGQRLGSGNKMEVAMHGYERSNHNLGFIWRSTMAAGTLVPFMSRLVLPGDTFDVGLNIDVKTHPTVGPLFGSYKIQADLFLCPIRIYQGQLHNNKLGIGMDMAKVKLPVITLGAVQTPDTSTPDIDNAQINPSCVLAYTGIRGVGRNKSALPVLKRDFSAIPLLGYWDIFKNYYANKQEDTAFVIHTTIPPIVQNISSMFFTNPGGTAVGIPLWPTVLNPVKQIAGAAFFDITTTALQPMEQVVLIFDDNSRMNFTDACKAIGQTATNTNAIWDNITHGTKFIKSYDYIKPQDQGMIKPQLASFDLKNIDTMRELILTMTGVSTPFIVNDANLPPYSYVLGSVGNFQNMALNQEGLALKTYQSDLLNNWIQAEWIEGPNSISEITAVDTSAGNFKIDQLNLSKKVYDMLNRIAVSGGTYDDWLDSVYDHDRFTRAETPMYMGGLIKELVFQELTSVAEAEGEEGRQPLGTLAGKGVMGNKHKGGHVVIKVDEPAYIMGIISLTPRLDYSQGNQWDVNLKTMDDFHKPQLDEIGFQDLITEQMAWWDTLADADAGAGYGNWGQFSAGKQPAWLNYMTDINQTRGNFADKNQQMFMTLNRRYEPDTAGRIKDITTYIDPSKFNHIFAQSSLDSQNFWVQVAVDIHARRKMSGKLMPNL